MKNRIKLVDIIFLILLILNFVLHFVINHFDPQYPINGSFILLFIWVAYYSVRNEEVEKKAFYYISLAFFIIYIVHVLLAHLFENYPSYLVIPIITISLIGLGWVFELLTKEGKTLKLRKYNIYLVFVNILLFIFVISIIMLFENFIFKEGLNVSNAIIFILVSIVLSYMLTLVDEYLILNTYNIKLKILVSRIKNRKELHFTRFLVMFLFWFYILTIFAIKILLFKSVKLEFFDSNYVIPAAVYFLLIEPINWQRVYKVYNLKDLKENRSKVDNQDEQIDSENEDKSPK